MLLLEPGLGKRSRDFGASHVRLVTATQWRTNTVPERTGGAPWKGQRNLYLLNFSLMLTCSAGRFFAYTWCELIHEYKMRKISLFKTSRKFFPLFEALWSEVFQYTQAFRITPFHKCAIFLIFMLNHDLSGMYIIFWQKYKMLTCSVLYDCQSCHITIKHARIFSSILVREKTSSIMRAF